MKRKIFAVVLLTALVLGGASAQLMFGVTGAIPMDSTKFKASDVITQLKEGNGVLYGFEGELAFRKVGFGISANTMSMWNDYYLETDQIIDVNTYISVHFVKARAFLDPFVELGVGLLGTVNPNDTTGNTPFYDASYYWSGTAGLGLNLGIVGAFVKFGMNFNINKDVMYTDSFGTDYPYARFGTRLFGSAIDVPAYKLTVGAKLIL